MYSCLLWVILVYSFTSLVLSVPVKQKRQVPSEESCSLRLSRTGIEVVLPGNISNAVDPCWYPNLESNYTINGTPMDNFTSIYKAELDNCNPCETSLCSVLVTPKEEGSQLNGSVCFTVSILPSIRTFCGTFGGGDLDSYCFDPMVENQEWTDEQHNKSHTTQFLTTTMPDTKDDSNIRTVLIFIVFLGLLIAGIIVAIACRKNIIIFLTAAAAINAYVAQAGSNHHQDGRPDDSGSGDSSSGKEDATEPTGKEESPTEREESDRDNGNNEETASEYTSKASGELAVLSSTVRHRKPPSDAAYRSQVTTTSSPQESVCSIDRFFSTTGPTESQDTMELDPSYRVETPSIDVDARSDATLTTKCAPPENTALSSDSYLLYSLVITGVICIAAFLSDVTFLIGPFVLVFISIIGIVTLIIFSLESRLLHCFHPFPREYHQHAAEEDEAYNNMVGDYGAVAGIVLLFAVLTRFSAWSLIMVFFLCLCVRSLVRDSLTNVI